MRTYDVVIVGAGHAGTQLAVALSAEDFAGSMALLGDEETVPYERPPLTKAFLAGDAQTGDLAFRPPAWWAASAVEHHGGAQVTAVEAANHIVVTADGERIGYGTLVWAAGGEARRLPIPGADLEGVHVVRRLSDAERIRERLTATRDAVVIGGGYIGLETAASLRRSGIEVTVVEAMPRLLQRVTGEEVADYVRQRHTREGVHVLLETGVSEIVGSSGHVAGVALSDGRTLPADLVVVGIGLIPNITPLVEAGAEAGNGVLVDEFCRTTLPDVYAIGDCASFVSPWIDGGRLRLESVQNANDQARVVAHAILGRPEPYRSVPWFWSHQYDDRLQTAGVLTGYDAAVLRGDPASGRFSVVYLRNGTIAAVDAVNNGRDYAQARSLIGVEVTDADLALLADPARPLKDVAARTLQQ
jgi:3-phenylpropionate/trans-cinnamate dioxygenase ferredoxin reductase component